MSVRNADKISPVIPWWTINGTVTAEDAVRQLDDFCEKGIREFFLYANFGLESPDFLTGEWFEFVAFLLQECPRRGMHFWIYDELSWPSGTAGGRLARKHPEYLMRTLRRSVFELQPAEKWQPEVNKEYIWCGVFTAGESVPQPIKCTQEFVNRTSAVQTLWVIEKVLIDDLFFSSMGTSGTLNERGIVDAMNPEAVRCWMSYTYTPYKERFSEELGKTIRGFFFDEPTMISPFHAGELPWTPGFEEKFSARYGYDCRELYWALWEPTSQMVQFRCDYWRLAAELFAEAFAGQISRWCAENGLLFAGHHWPEEPSCQRLMTNAVGDIYYQQQYLSVPGTDFLYYENCYTQAAGMNPQSPKWARNLIYSAKHPSSVARYNNSVHTICESSACLKPAGSPPAVQKIMYDFLYAMGISLMNPARPFDLKDFRKFVCQIDAGQPYWQYYRRFVEYMQIMSDFNSCGRTCTQIAVLNCTSTKFAYSNLTNDTSIRQETTPLPPEGDCAEAMLCTLDALVRKHRDFELIFEDVLLNSSVTEDGTLLAPNSNFKVIILPQCYALDDAVWEKLAEFERKGGVLIAVGDKPSLPLKHDHTLRDIVNLECRQLAPGSDFNDRLANLLESVLPAEYIIEGDGSQEVLSHWRKDNEWSALFLANGTSGSKTVTLTGKALENFKSLTDLQTSEVYHWTGEAKITLKEGESLLLTSNEAAENAPLYSAEYNVVQTLAGNLWRLSKVPRNTMRAALECQIHGEYCSIDDTGLTGVNLDPEDSPVVNVRGTFYIEERIPEDLRLWFDQHNITGLKVNSQSVELFKKEKFFTDSSVTFPIAHVCRIGRNEVTFTAGLSPWMLKRNGIREHLHMLMKNCTPTVLMGAFAAGNGHTVKPLPEAFERGSLELQGLAMFADELVLEACFDCCDVEKINALELQESDLPISVELNGKDLGTRFWRSGLLKIPAGLLKKSGNTLKLKLCGEMKNLLERGWLGTAAEHVDFVLPEVSLIKYGG